MKAVLLSIIISAIIHLGLFFGGLAIGYVQTVFYQPDFSEAESLHMLDTQVAFGYTGNILTAFSTHTIIGAFLIWAIMELVSQLRTVK